MSKRQTLLVCAWFAGPFGAWGDDLTDKAAAAKALATARQELRELVDSLATGTREQAEEAYRRAGTDDFRSTYAIALIRTRDGDYKAAAEALDSLPNADKRHPACMRLRLWVALELKEEGRVGRIFDGVVRGVQEKAQRHAERLESAKALGAIAVLVGAQPPEEASISSDRLREAEVAIKAMDDAAYNEAYAASQEATRRRLQEIKEIAKSVGDKNDGERRTVLEERQREYAELESKVASLEADLQEALSENREKFEQEAKPFADLKRRRNLLLKAWNTETPGKPREPREPSKPSPPRLGSKSDKDDKDTDRDRQREYERALDRYERDLENYRREKETYAARLADWKVADRVRREEIRRLQDVVHTGIKEIEDGREERTQRIAAQRREVEGEERMANDLRLEIGLLKSLSAGDFTAASQRVQSCPFNYKLISYATEQKRMLQLEDN
jgi:hypothetical protein